MAAPSANRPLWAWVALGVLGYLAFPWYAQQDANGLLALGQVFGDAPAANGLLQAALYGRPWLWLGLLGLAVAGVGAALPAGRRQGAALAARWGWRGCCSAALPSARAAGRMTG